MSAQHTPGPWFFCEEDRCIYPVRWNGKDNGDSRALIAQVSSWNGSAQHDREAKIAAADANARLIASAPNMHALLIEALESLERADFKHVEDATAALDLRQRIAALARAGVAL